MTTEADKIRPESEASATMPTQAQLLRRNLAVSARVARLAIDHPELNDEVKAVLASTMALLTDWEQYSHGLSGEVVGKDREVEDLRAIVSAQAHRIQLAEEMLADMTTLAKKDHLTGAWNTFALAEAGPGLFERMRKSGKPLSCLFLDLDYFKRINDAYGHEAGDYVLKSLAKTIGDQSRLSDFLFRLGGGAEEFCLLLPETDVEGAVILAERIRVYLEQNTVKYEGHNLLATASIGVAQADFSKHTCFDEIKKQADLAQGVAKKTRNTVVSYHHANGMPEAYKVRSPDNRYIPTKTSRYGEAEEVEAAGERNPFTA